MAALQLAFALRTPSGVKTVHLIGSWDHYAGQLPLAKDKTSKSGTWKGTFRFQGTTLEPGQRYWYYYIIDGYHVCHDPGQASTTEPTTGRVLNILDVPHERSNKSSSSRHSPLSKSSSSSKHSSSSRHSSSPGTSSSSSRHSSSSGTSSSKQNSTKLSSKNPSKCSSSSRNSSLKQSSSKHHPSKSPHLNSHTPDIPKGRPLSISQIQSPKPVNSHATKHILEADYYAAPTIAELTSRFSRDVSLSEVDYYLSASPPSSVGSSLSSRSDDDDDNDAHSSASSLSDFSAGGSPLICTCERYGITREGSRVKLDCGGARCGYSDDDSSCCSSGGEEDLLSPSSRRRGVVVHR